MRTLCTVSSGPRCEVAVADVAVDRLDTDAAMLTLVSETMLAHRHCHKDTTTLPLNQNQITSVLAPMTLTLIK